jgi:hypothetical protein
MFNLAAGNDWFLNLIRTTIFPPMAKFILSIDAVKKRFFPLISQIGISYPDSFLSANDHEGHFEVKAGDRLPYFLDEGHSIYDRLHAPKFHLVSFIDPAHSDQMLTELVANRQDVIEQISIPLTREVEEKFGAKKPFNVLLRPDNYIALITSDTSPAAIESYFQKILR